MDASLDLITSVVTGGAGHLSSPAAAFNFKLFHQNNQPPYYKMGNHQVIVFCTFQNDKKAKKRQWQVVLVACNGNVSVDDCACMSEKQACVGWR